MQFTDDLNVTFIPATLFLNIIAVFKRRLNKIPTDFSEMSSLFQVQFHGGLNRLKLTKMFDENVKN
jgi:hypothetical protein